ncbi:MAG: hypothetical protein II943_03555 [Victivallales bacterium]|nr:hypothetical protein [Victivallales bacterium]
MIPDIGKTACAVIGPDDYTYLLFNHAMNNPLELSYENSEGIHRKMVFGDDEATHSYRALHYLRLSPAGGVPGIPRPVPYIEGAIAAEEEETPEPEPPDPENPPAEGGGEGGSGGGSGGGGETGSDSPLALPLYEVITPQAGILPGRPGFVLSFWTNLSEAASGLLGMDGRYHYDSTKILRFDANALGDVDLDSYSWKILCTAEVIWDRMKVNGGTLAIADTNMMPIPVVTHIEVNLALNGNLAIDFGSGEGGGGMRRHNHADNSRGGFAYAVWAPGCTLNPVNWY